MHVSMHRGQSYPHFFWLFAGAQLWTGKILEKKNFRVTVVLLPLPGANDSQIANEAPVLVYRYWSLLIFVSSLRILGPVLPDSDLSLPNYCRDQRHQRSLTNQEMLLFSLSDEVTSLHCMENKVTTLSVIITRYLIYCLSFTWLILDKLKEWLKQQVKWTCWRGAIVFN